MFVLTPADRKTVSTEREFTVAFEEHRDHGDRCFQLHRDDGAHLSAIGEGFGPYTLEWFPPEKTGTHLRVAEELKSQEVLGRRSSTSCEEVRRGGNLTPGMRSRTSSPRGCAQFLGRFSRKKG